MKYLAAAVLLASSAFASPPLTMMHVVFRSIYPGVSQDEFVSLPKTFYLAGDKYLRLEEPDDRQRNLKVVMIANEPDAWDIDLVSKTGAHSVDTEVPPVVHTMLVAELTGEWSKLEVGKEPAFFQAHDQKPAADREVLNHACKGVEVAFDGRRALLYTDVATGKVAALESYFHDKLEWTCVYLAYDTNVPFDAALFAPPKGVKITEAGGSDMRVLETPAPRGRR